MFIGGSNNLTELNIGFSDSRLTNAIINIGNSGDQINIAGTLNYVNEENLVVQDKTIVLNSST